MLNRIEGGYLQLLRVVILIAATVALICVVLLGMRASEGLFVKPIKVSEEIKIAPKSFKTGKIADAPKTAESKAQSDEVKKLAQALGSVLSKHYSRLVKPAGSLNGAAIEEVVVSYVNNKELGPSFVEGLTKYLDDSLSLDESAAGTKSSDSFFDDVDKIFKHYETQYKAERARIESEKHAAAADVEAKKLDAIQALYWSASCFAAFGMLVLLIVLIRVERSIHRLATSKTNFQTP
jgi:hypothetical protein